MDEELDLDYVKYCVAWNSSFDEWVEEDAQRFERWIAKHDAEVGKATVARIINLLESNHNPMSFQHGGAMFEDSCASCEIITLIQENEPVGETDKLGEAE